MTSRARRSSWAIVRSLSIALALTVALAWGIGRVVTDRFPVIQYLYWIPTIVALAITLVCAISLARSNWRRYKWVLWGIAFVQAIVFVLQDYRIVGSSPVARAGVGSSIGIAHINAGWPGDSSAILAGGISDGLKRVYGDPGPDILLISEPGRLLDPQVAIGRCMTDARAVSVGRFAVVSRVPIVDAMPLYDDAKSSAAFVRFGPWHGIPSWGALLVDFPSDPSIARSTHLAKFRSQLESLRVPSALVIVGDFNTTRGGSAVQEFAPTMRDAFTAAGIGYGATYPRAFPLWHIDLMLIAPSVLVERYEIIDTGFGKHRMQVATMRFELGTDSPRETGQRNQ